MIDPQILSPELMSYINNLLPNMPKVFDDINKQARENRQPVVSNDAGWFMHIITQLIKPKKILEIGCNIGYSATWLGTALDKDAHIDTIEINKDIAQQAEDNFRKAGLSKQIKVHVGAALEVIPTLEGPYDMVFIDAVKREYIRYVELTLPKVKTGGLYLVDNVLWSGKVTQTEIPKEDKMTLALHQFNQYFMSHPQIKGTTLTIGDGLSFGIKV